MLQLTKEQKGYLLHHEIPLSAVFDATGMKRKEYQALMGQLDKYVAIGVSPCGAKGHTMKLKAGHCFQCSSAGITFRERFYMNAFVYVAISSLKKLIKIGYTQEIKERAISLNKTEYARANDWKIIYSAECNNAGKVESEIQSKLSDYSTPGEYIKTGRVVACYELFNCSYKRVKEAIGKIKRETQYHFNNEYELENAVELFDFEDIATNTKVRIGNTSGNNTNRKPLPVSEQINVIKEAVLMDRPKEEEEKRESHAQKNKPSRNKKDTRKNNLMDKGEHVTSLINKIFLVLIMLVILYLVLR